MDRNIIIIIVFLVVLNMTLALFGTLQFFTDTPSVTDSEGDPKGQPPTNLDVRSVGAFIAFISSIVLASLIAIGLSIVTHINVMKMVLFMNIFWIPYIQVVGLIHNVLSTGGTPLALTVGVEGIFTVVMLFVFGWALMEMSDVATQSGGGLF